jgi:4-hydroxy-tetrahydrodipicolinate reductase
MKIAIIGNGKMGKIVEQLAAGRGHQAYARFGSSESSLSAGEMSEKLAGADVAIDFSDASAVERNVEACVTAGVPLVLGTTGWKDRLDAIKTVVTDNDGSIVFGANFSIGMNLFFRITDFAAQLFSRFPEYEAFIEEQHHSRKRDAPSGTALKLRDIVSRHIDKEFSIASTRAGNIPGTHRVGFDGVADQIVLEHVARSREGFAAGAVLAAEWIIGKKGFYEFGDVIDEILSERKV